MSPVIAEMLLDQMDQMGFNFTWYRGQRYSRLYLRRVLWRSNIYQDHQRAMRYASRVVPMEGCYGK